MSTASGRRAINKLTDRKVKAFVRSRRAGGASTTPSKLFDGGGLFLFVSAAGTPLWRVKYRIGGKERLYAIGSYDTISLEDARKQTDWVKSQLREGKDPVLARRVEKASEVTASEKTFGGVTSDWLRKQKADWSDIHYTKSKRALERDVLPLLGKLPVGEIKPVMMANVIEAIDRRGARDTAAKVLWHCVSIFKLAQARGLCDINPAEPVSEVLSRKKTHGHQPAILKFPGLGKILRDAEEENLSKVVHFAHRLLAFSVCRIANVVEAKWKEFDLESDVPIWVVPRPLMKKKDRPFDHKVILCREVVKELRQWQRVVGSKGYLFPSPITDTHITRETIEKAYRETLGLRGKHVPHGWRAAFSTLAKDNDFDKDAVELALDHVHDSEVARAYDRGERLNQRIELMGWWGKELVGAQRGAKVVRLKGALTA